MKTRAYRFKTGLYTAAQSFSLIWTHKKLLLYALCATGLSFLATIVLYNVLSLSFPDRIGLTHLLREALCALNPVCSSATSNMFLLATTSFLILASSSFFMVAMLHCAGHIVAGEQGSFIESLRKVLTKLPIIIIWALFSLVIEQLAMTGATSASSLLSFLTLLLIISIRIATFFVLPLIAYSHETFLGILRMSWTITKNLFVEMTGGGLWFFIIASLLFIPMALFWSQWHIPGTTHAIAPWHTSNFILAGALIVQFLIRVGMATAFALFKALLYSDYRRKNPTIDESYRHPWPS